MAKKPKPRTYYVSWIGTRSDPWTDYHQWSEWEKQGRPSSGSPDLKARSGEVLELLPEDHKEWPSVPVINETVTPVLGPILSDFFHPKSDYQLAANKGSSQRQLCKAHLLYTSKAKEQSKELKQVIDKLCKVRKWDSEIVEDHEIKIEDPTDHKEIVSKLRSWITDPCDPFDLQEDTFRGERRIEVNLSSGSPSMHASWMMLFWAGGFQNSKVQFFQGDPKFDLGKSEWLKSQPNRYIEFEQITQLRTAEQQAEASGKESELDSSLEKHYKSLADDIKKAAALRLPITLTGERGSGKTLFARKYHEWLVDHRKKQEIKKDKGQFVTLTLSEHKEVAELRDQLFGWRKGAFTNATSDFKGFLGMAHHGTLFLDEIHHLPESLQAALLGPLNDGKYFPKPAANVVEEKSEFALVVATNDPSWENRLTEDFLDRIKRIVLEVPSFREIRSLYPQTNPVWDFFRSKFKERCRKCEIEDPFDSEDSKSDEFEHCEKLIQGKLQHHPLPGNWRDILRISDQLLFQLCDPRGGRPILRWNEQSVNAALEAALP